MRAGNLRAQKPICPAEIGQGLHPRDTPSKRFGARSCVDLGQAASVRADPRLHSRLQYSRVELVFAAAALCPIIFQVRVSFFVGLASSEPKSDRNIRFSWLPTSSINFRARLPFFQEPRLPEKAPTAGYSASIDVHRLAVHAFRYRRASPPGTPNFCALVLHTKTLEEFIGLDLPGRAHHPQCQNARPCPDPGMPLIPLLLSSILDLVVLDITPPKPAAPCPTSVESRACAGPKSEPERHRSDADRR